LGNNYNIAKSNKNKHQKYLGIHKYFWRIRSINYAFWCFELLLLRANCYYFLVVG